MLIDEPFLRAGINEMRLIGWAMVVLFATAIDLKAAPRTGYLVIDASTGNQLFSATEQETFMTASTMKLVTALAALDHFGPEHRFETSLATAGTINDGVLDGELVLRGQGDVELDIDDLMAFALALRNRGIRNITGRFLVADSQFLRVDMINPNQPVDAPYNAGIGPLSLAFGRVQMRPTGDGTYFANPPLDERGPAWRIVTGLKPNSARAIPVRDVGLYTARTLKRIAGEMGIELPPPTRGSPKAQPRKLSVVMSKTMEDLVEGMLVYSNNQMAETLGLATSAAMRIEPASLAESATGLWRDLATRLPEIDWEGFRITNHSGLDPQARATPAQLVTLLNYGLINHALPQMMPANGWSGSLRRRLDEPGTLQRIWAKTGSLDFASAMAGYLMPKTGGLWIFAILSDDPQRRAAYDGMGIPSAAIRAEAQSWEDDVKATHDSLLRYWMSL